jgi:hypothetical protein
MARTAEDNALQPVLPSFLPSFAANGGHYFKPCSSLALKHSAQALPVRPARGVGQARRAKAQPPKGWGALRKGGLKKKLPQNKKPIV